LNFKTKLLAAAVLPVILISIMSYWVINKQSANLAHTQIATLKQRTLDARRAELEKMNQLALNTIRPLFESTTIPGEEAKKRAKRLLHDMAFGEDGYFFVYDLKGTNLVHPRLPNLVGHNWWDLQDPNGDYVIRNLVSAAQNGGGFHAYVWNKPSTGNPAPKIGHAVLIKQWGWMVGTGLYTDDVEAEVAVLREELQRSIDRTGDVILALTIMAILLAALFTYFIRLSEQRFADQRLKELTHRIVEVQEDERKRVSVELHDGISQLLVSARYSLDSAMEGIGVKSKSRPAMTKSMGILDDAVREVRRISMALRPSVLDDIGLAAAIKSLGQEFGQRSSTKVQTKTESVGDRISDTARTALYRVAQEALTNVAKHSEASSVWIKLQTTASNVTLSIEDNGNGRNEARLFNAQSTKKTSIGKTSSAPTTGMGIRNMRERMHAIQGNLDIQLSRKGGLKVVATVPVDSNKTHPIKTATAPQFART